MNWISVKDKLPEIGEEVLTLHFYDYASGDMWMRNGTDYNICKFEKLVTKQEPFFKQLWTTKDGKRVKVHFWMSIDRYSNNTYFYIADQEIKKARSDENVYLG